jgi:hypothetical protein
MTDIVYSKKEALGFCCEPIPNGWTYTLITRLGEMLREIEGRYGTRDRDWTLLGIEFGGSRPCLWYPGDCGYVSIKLSENARTDPQRWLNVNARQKIPIELNRHGQLRPM